MGLACSQRYGKNYPLQNPRNGGWYLGSLISFQEFQGYLESLVSFQVFQGTIHRFLDSECSFLPCGGPSLMFFMSRRRAPRGNAARQQQQRGDAPRLDAGPAAGGVPPGVVPGSSAARRPAAGRLQVMNIADPAGPRDRGLQSDLCLSSGLGPEALEVVRMWRSGEQDPVKASSVTSQSLCCGFNADQWRMKQNRGKKAEGRLHER